jgi:hypothetical protein
MRYYKFNRSKDLGPLESFTRSHRIQKLQYELGLTISHFPDLDIPEFGFLLEDYTTNMDDESSSGEDTELEFNDG